MSNLVVRDTSGLIISIKSLAELFGLEVIRTTWIATAGKVGKELTLETRIEAALELIIYLLKVLFLFTLKLYIYSVSFFPYMILRTFSFDFFRVSGDTCSIFFSSMISKNRETIVGSNWLPELFASSSITFSVVKFFL